MKNYILIAVAVIITIGVLSGCGGGGSGGATLTGTVVDGTNDTPLQNVRVALGTANTTTAADGSFTLSGLATGTGIVTFQLDNYEITSLSVDIAAGANTLPDTVKMAPVSGQPPDTTPRTIQGTITLSDESNPSGVTVTLLSVTTQYDQMTTGADGNYHFWAPAGTYTIRASKTGFVTENQQVTVSDLTQVLTVNITLAKS